MMNEHYRRGTIYVVFRGRTGNQFFQYAFARKLQEITHIKKLVFDFSELGVNMSIGKYGTNGYSNALVSFNVVPYEHVDEGVSVRKDFITMIQYSIYRLRRKLCSTVGFKKSLKLEKYDSRLLQFLGCGRDKIVVAPPIWRNENPPVTDIYMTSWTILD